MTKQQQQQRNDRGDKKRKDKNNIGRNGNSSNNNNNNRNNKMGKKLSHHLSWALRHAAADLGLTMTPDAYVPVQEILESTHPKFRGVTLEEIQQVVESNDKQRFSLAQRPYENYYKPPSSTTATTSTADSEYGDGGQVDNLPPATILCIRANQGHSIKNVIDPNLLLTCITKEELQEIPTIVHGTYSRPYESIQTQGLKCMNRTHIHFASGLPQEDGVISGMRQTCQIYIFINSTKCAEDGIPFFKSDNGVLLTAGVNNQGTLPVEYFSHVIEAESGNLLLDQR